MPLWKSRKFLLLLLDVIISLATYFVGRFVAPEMAKDILWAIGIMQPVFVAIIVAISVEDSAAIKAGVHPRLSRQ